MKNRHIIFLLMIIIALIGIILSVTYALNINITENTTNDYDLSYTFDISDNATWTINVEPGKTKIYELTLTNPYNDSIKYGIAYKLENPTELPEGVTIEVSDTSSSLPQDLLEVNKTNNIEVEIKNNSTNNIQITLCILTGYKNGGDLIIPDNYVLLTKEERYYLASANYDIISDNNAIECLTLLGDYGYYDSGDGLRCLADQGPTFLNTSIKNAQIVSISFIKSSEIPSNVSEPIDVSKDKDGSVMFYYKLSSITSSVASDVSLYDTFIATKNGKVYLSDGKGLFSAFVSLQEINLSNVYTEEVTNMRGMFGGCISLENLDLGNFETINVTDMSYMFSSTGSGKYITQYINDPSLKIVDLSSFDTSKVTDMSYMFFDNTAITTIYASNKFNTSNVTRSYSMFENSSKLVGGNGTAYNSSYIDKTYARIDASGTPGYFTSK